MGIHFDTRQLNELAIDMEDAPGRLQRNSDKIVRGFARRVQLGWRKEASGHRYLRKLPSTVGVSRLGPASYEIGFDKVGQGKLANILVFGSVNNGPVFWPFNVVRDETPRMVNDLADMAEQEAVTREGS